MLVSEERGRVEELEQAALEDGRRTIIDNRPKTPPNKMIMQKAFKAYQEPRWERDIELSPVILTAKLKRRTVVFAWTTFTVNPTSLGRS